VRDTLRILTVVKDLRPGGTQRVARNFAAAYRQFNVESALFAYQSGGALEESVAQDNVELIPRNAKDLQFGLSQAIAWQPDVVHIHRAGVTDAVSGSIIRALRHAPRRGTTARVGMLETNVFARADYSEDAAHIDVHFFLSKWCLWKWQGWAADIRPRPLGVVLPNLVMHAEFQRPAEAARRDFRRQWRIPQEALLFGRIGSPLSSKWSPVILSAFSSHARRNPAARLLLVGLPDDLKSAVAALPADIRARIAQIDFLHGNRVLCEAYAAMDVFLHAAQIGESFGMVLAEALCCGTPVITLSTPAKDNSQLEIVGHRRGGLVVASEAGMVEAMIQMEDPATRERLARNGAAHIQAHFGVSQVVPLALEIATASAAGLTPEVLRSRVAAMTGVTTEASSHEIQLLMRDCIGRYPIGTPALLRLVSAPLLYRAYRALKYRNHG
jgi:glycosyltransferase involved in cell wall biosynthesis